MNKGEATNSTGGDRGRRQNYHDGSVEESKRGVWSGDQMQI